MLAQALPGVAVKVTTDVQSKRTAADMLKTMPSRLAAAKPALVIWQTGTVDAMQAVDPDQFSAALEQGIKAAHAAGADIVLVNSQYSPRSESTIALGTYEEDMRWVALQQQIPAIRSLQYYEALERIRARLTSIRPRKNWTLPSVSMIVLADCWPTS